MFHRETVLVGIGLMLLLSWSSGQRLVEGKRIAVQKCEEYQKATLFPTSIELESDNCTNEVKPIPKGEVAKYGEFPHHVLLGYPKTDGEDGLNFGCEGTLISDQHVMTAAHCVSNVKPTVVRLGEYDTTFVAGDEHEVGIAAIRTHPQYRKRLSYHDIALVKLVEQLIFTKIIRPACLWDTEERNITRYVLSGFGAMSYMGPPSTIMRKVQLEEITFKECNETLNTKRKFPGGLIDGQLCARGIVDAFDTCRGFSGSPLQTVTSTTSCMYHVLGITSAGEACDKIEAKAVYTKVSYYIDWIEENVWGPNSL